MSNTKSYSLCLWGSHPDSENDDCWTGEDFATREEAEAALADPWGVGGFDRAYYEADTAFLELDGPDVNRVEPNPGFAPRARRPRCREAQHQAAMAHGTAGWNDYEGA